MSKRRSMDMTQGVIWKQIVAFALPLLVGNLFQQLYNTVDSVIVGQFVSKEALAAVGSVGPIINMLVGFFMGLSAGAGVVISQYFGAKDHKMVGNAVHTALAMTLVLSVLLTVVGISFTPLALRLMSTPDDVLGESATYLRIYFAGVIGLLFYNIGAGILRAVGDSRRPLYFLILSSVLNVALDLLFVIALDMGIAGVAWATVISQIISAVLVLIVLGHSQESYRFVPKEMRLHMPILSKIIRVGLPAGIQMMITAFSNIFVQGYINQFGSACMAGWTSYNKLDQLLFLPVTTLGLSVTTFVGQNLGAGNVKRAKRGTITCYCMAVSITILLTVLMILFNRPLLTMFGQDEDMLYYGSLFVRYLSIFYFCICANQVFAGALRGAGDATAPMVIMISSFVVIRQLYLFVISRIANTPLWIGMSYPVGWFVCSSAMMIYYYLGRWERKSNLTGKT